MQVSNVDTTNYPIISQENYSLITNMSPLICEKEIN